MKTMPATQVAGIFIMGFVRGDSRDQGALFPVSLDELVPLDHFCRVIDALVGSLGFLQLGFSKAQPATTGRPAYDPADLLKLYLSGYLQQVRSSRRLERECQRNVELMWLLNRLAPDHKTIAEFRRCQGAALRAVAAAFVRFCRGQGLIRGEWLAIDGSKFEAVASRKSVLSRERLLREQAALDRRVAEYLEGLDGADAKEGEATIDAGAVREALEVLRHQQAQTAQGLGRLQALGTSHWVESEPDARLMKGHGPAYNVQTVVDAEHALIVTHVVTAEAKDNTSLQPMAEAARDALEQPILNVVADAGYSNGAQAEALEAQRIVAHIPANRAVNNQGEGAFLDRTSFAYDEASDTLRCPAGQTLQRKQLQRGKHRVLYAAAPRDCAACPLKARCTQQSRRLVTRHLYEAALQRMHDRATPWAMRLRRCTVEHPFASLKYRIFERPRFLVRGRWGAGTEMSLATLVWNLKRAMAVVGSVGLTERLART
jgi:transposase